MFRLTPDQIADKQYRCLSHDRIIKTEQQRMLYILGALNSPYPEIKETIVKVIKKSFPQYQKIVDNPEKYLILK